MGVLCKKNYPPVRGFYVLHDQSSGLKLPMQQAVESTSAAGEPVWVWFSNVLWHFLLRMCVLLELNPNARFIAVM